MKKISKFLLLFLLTIGLTNCQQSKGEKKTQKLPYLPSKSGNVGKTVIKTLEPGAYCFDYQDENISSTAQVLVAADYSLTGNIDSIIHNQKESYYTSYNQQFAGIVDNNNLEVSINTKIGNNWQKNQEKWQVRKNLLITSKYVYKNINCEALIAK